MFLQVSVCPQGGGCLPQCMLGCHTPPPDQADTPQDQADPLGPGRPPWDQADPPRTRQTPLGPGRSPPETDSSIRSTSSRYASYWNAFLFYFVVTLVRVIAFVWYLIWCFGVQYKESSVYTVSFCVNKWVLDNECLSVVLLALDTQSWEKTLLKKPYITSQTCSFVYTQPQIL